MAQIRRMTWTKWRAEDDYEIERPIEQFGFVVRECRFYGFCPRPQPKRRVIRGIRKRRKR